jgi:DnaJ-domain-containing protein 1
MNKYQRPTGGRGKKANYKTVVVRIPEPILSDVEQQIAQFHEENHRYCERPIIGQWWEVLGVLPSASKDEIKTAYRQLVKLYHPDRNKRLDAEVRFSVATNAYQEGRDST